MSDDIRHAIRFQLQFARIQPAEMFAGLPGQVHPFFCPLVIDEEENLTRCENDCTRSP